MHLSPSLSSFLLVGRSRTEMPMCKAGIKASQKKKKSVLLETYIETHPSLQDASLQWLFLLWLLLHTEGCVYLCCQ